MLILLHLTCQGRFSNATSQTETLFLRKFEQKFKVGWVLRLSRDYEYVEDAPHFTRWENMSISVIEYIHSCQEYEFRIW